MADQLSFASLDFAAKKKLTKRDVFLAEMAAIVPWAKLEALIEPTSPGAGNNQFALLPSVQLAKDTQCLVAEWDVMIFCAVSPSMAVSPNLRVEVDVSPSHLRRLAFPRRGQDENLYECVWTSPEKVEGFSDRIGESGEH